jgi:putative oxidoreductase
MKKLTSTKYSAGAFNVGMLVLRLCMGGLLLPMGYDKLIKFAEIKVKMINFLGMGQGLSLGLLIFAEFFCAALVVLGLFTRFAAIPPIIAMTTAVFEAHGGRIFSDGGHAAMFALGFFVILLLGPGRISVDGAISK